MASDPPLDLTFRPLNGKPRALREMLTTFHLAFVALDPFTNEAAWILPTALRVLRNFEQADVRVAFVVTGTAEECRLFLGPYAREVLVFADPDREIIKGCDLNRLPAFVHIAMDGTVVNAAEGWQPRDWRQVAEALAQYTSWRGPVIPIEKDPGPFEGSPALG